MSAKLIRVTAKVMLTLLLAIIVGALAVVIVIPRAVHGAALTVLTGSMTPTIPVGSIVVVRPVDPGTLHVGDVITFQKQAAKAEFITPRIVAIHTKTNPVTLTTKGDANRGADVAPVPVTAVRGRVLFHVPYLGTIRSAIGTGGAGPLLLLVALIVYAVAQLVSGLRDRRAGHGDVIPQSVASRPQVIATLSADTFGGLPPQQVAELLGMHLLDETADHFTVAASREPDQLNALTQLLMIFKPVSLERADAGAVPVLPVAVGDESRQLEQVGGTRVGV
jgi:signal peptidase